MAFTKNPVAATYQNKDIPLIAPINSRGTSPTKDVDYLNCYPELTKNKLSQQPDIRLRKRSGCAVITPLVNTITRGMYYWEDQQKL